MKLNVSQFHLIRIHRVCVCCYPCRVKWLNTRSVVGDVIRCQKFVFSFHFCQKSEVFLVSFSWSSCGYRRHSSVGELWTSSQSVRALLHVLCFCTASLLAPVASSSLHVEITSLLLISNRTFYFCLRGF